MKKNYYVKIIGYSLLYFIALTIFSGIIWTIYFLIFPERVSLVNQDFVLDLFLKLLILFLAGGLVGALLKKKKDILIIMPFLIFVNLVLGHFIYGTDKEFTHYGFINVLKYPLVLISIGFGFVIRSYIVKKKLQ